MKCNAGIFSQQKSVERSHTSLASSTYSELLLHEAQMGKTVNALLIYEETMPS